ncbi:hypothetical protein [Streptomyces sp. CC219B]|uniref:hypothetical protein n=1 Tax=Streptomyces sp. CC219B TaxID=3044574 RepID=UPI0024A8F233|nr:hypothetical protein [Streptomyces sp. CC219B]
MTQQHPSAPASAQINMAEPLYGAAADRVRDQLRESSDLQVAVRVGQRMLDAYSDSSVDGFSYPEACGALREALRILLRACGAEAVDAR